MTTLTTAELEERLQAIAAAEFAVPGDEAERETLIAAMLAEIGNPDPHLRDDLIYMTLGSWCYYRRLPAERRRQLLHTLLGEEHLFYRVGEAEESDAVFTRSFSVLLLPTILAGHEQEPFLTAAEIAETKRQVLAYLRREQDRRGYVPGPGWAHAPAHTADALGALAQMEEIGAEGLAEILAGIHFLATAEERGYAENEDGRLATAAGHVLGRGLLPAEAWTAWLERFAPAEGQGQAFPAGFYRNLNASHFLMSFYFRLGRPEVVEGQDAALVADLRERIEGVVRWLSG